MNKIDTLIKKLLSEEGKLSLHLIEAKIYAEEHNDEFLKDFIDKELNGYSAQELPDYRKIQGVIIGTIQDSYGQILYKGKSLDFSVLSDHIGFDLSVVLIPDSIGFIEDGLQNLTGVMAERPIPIQLVKMLNETFKHNNPHLNLVSASHEFGKASIQFILTKVRQELILGLQRINKDEKIRISEVTEDLEKVPKTIFVSYAWTNTEHNDKIISFVNFLRQQGYDASMDRKMSQEESAINLNKMMVLGIQNSEKVILVLDKKYKEKADKFEGGVGREMEMILEEIKTNANKFILVSFGEDDYKEILPNSLSGREVLNLKKDQDENEFSGLFAKIESRNLIQFSDVNSSTPEIKPIIIKPFKL